MQNRFQKQPIQSPMSPLNRRIVGTLELKIECHMVQSMSGQHLAFKIYSYFTLAMLTLLIMSWMCLHSLFIIVWQRNWPDVRFDNCLSLFRLSDISRLQGYKQLAVHLYIVCECGIVVSPHITFFPVDPPRVGVGVQKSTVVLWNLCCTCCSIVAAYSFWWWRLCCC